MAPETSLGGAAGAFGTTRWSLILSGRRADSPEARVAMSQLIRLYWKPVYLAVRRRGRAREEAKDLTQEFFLVFLETPFLERADPSRGRFRSYLKAALDHFLADERDRAGARKRGGDRAVLSLDLLEAERWWPAVEREAPDRVLDRAWARELIERALEELSRRAPQRYIQALRLRFQDGLSYAEIAERLGIGQDDVVNALHRGGVQLRAILEEEVRQTLADPAGAADELRCLRASFE